MATCIMFVHIYGQAIQLTLGDGRHDLIGQLLEYIERTKRTMYSESSTESIDIL